MVVGDLLLFQYGPMIIDQDIMATSSRMANEGLPVSLAMPNCSAITSGSPKVVMSAMASYQSFWIYKGEISPRGKTSCRSRGANAKTYLPDGPERVEDEITSRLIRRGALKRGTPCAATGGAENVTVEAVGSCQQQSSGAHFHGTHFEGPWKKSEIWKKPRRSDMINRTQEKMNKLR